MRKKLLSIAIAAASVVAISSVSAVTLLTGDSLYDTAINQLASATTPDARKAGIGLLENALAEGDGRAAMKLAALSLQDVGKFGDDAYRRAVDYYGQAVALGAPMAKSAYAITSANRGYFAGKDTSEGRAFLAEAMPRLQAAAPEGDKDVLWQLGYLETTGLGGQRDSIMGHDHILAAADAGQGSAALWVANRFSAAIPAEPESELKYLKIAAKSGIKLAKDRLVAFENNLLLSQPIAGNLPTTEILPTPVSAMAGVALAAVGSAPLIQPPALQEPAGTASTVDPEEVAVLKLELQATNRQLQETRAQLEAALRKTGELDAAALANLNHEGLEAVLAGNYELAVVRFREAAKHDYPAALANLGLMYLNATGVTRDGRQALALLERAAKKGNLVAAENIARAYDFGLGVHQDRSRAIGWYTRAASMGSTTAPAALQRLTQ